MNDPSDSRPATRDNSETEPQIGARLVVDVVRMDGDWSAFEPVEAAVAAAADAVAANVRCKIGNAEASLALSCDHRVAELNDTYRGKSKPTNVLSFPAAQQFSCEPGAPVFLGDIVLAAKTLLIEASEQGLAPRDHLQHLVVHGLLHLLGFDHETGHDAEAMEALEIEILASLGVANPYREDSSETVLA